jgi:hypothetical protein
MARKVGQIVRRGARKHIVGGKFRRWIEVGRGAIDAGDSSGGTAHSWLGTATVPPANWSDLRL